jgi:AAA+ superfamily predicted ATPase
MELINCIAGVIMSRTAVVFSDRVKNFWGEFGELEEFCKGISIDDYNECILQEKGKRYGYIAETILERDRLAQNVLDLSIAQMLFPSFGALLRRYTGYGACILNASKLELQSFDMAKMLKAYKLLNVLFVTDDTASFFQTEYFCDNRLLAYLNSRDDCFVPKGISRNENNTIVLDTEFIDKGAMDKAAADVIREAKLYNASIYILGENNKSLQAKVSASGIPWEMKKNPPSGVIEEPDKYITMDDLIIPARQKDMLGQICNHVRYGEKVYKGWGMETKYRYGKGVPVLFEGPPGTGKTMAAHVLSNMLDIPLYKVDLSQVADKYIGETEKHLQKIFDFADENQMLLFFDEADAIFGRRSEVKDSKDRYANMEISYILQRIEQYDGIAILASNLSENIDSAFIRRMKYLVDFPMPDKDMRLQIWKNGFSKGVPKDDIDYEYLAESFELAGGNIKNIILTATFLAAGRNENVGMGHIFEGIKNEYHKYNKKMTVGDFGKYGYMLL